MSAAVAVVGAGIAGLVCARELTAAGRIVTVFDKGRSAGGRLATRRLPLVGIDHGAQYVTATDPSFQSYIELAESAGVVAPWWPRIRNGAAGPTADRPWYVGVPGMSSLARPLATGLDIRQQVRIAGIEYSRTGWSLLSVSGDTLGPFDTLVLAVPAPQACDLCEDYPDIVARLASIEMVPCWAAMLAVADRVELAYDVDLAPGRELIWMARNSSKPGRAAGHETWVLHAGAEFSARRLDAVEADVGLELLAVFRELTGCTHAARLALAHCWRYARTATPLGEPCLWDSSLRLGICGDWCLGARLEASWSSARALAQRIGERVSRAR